MSEKVDITEFMDGYEMRVYKGYKKSAGDYLKDKRVFSNMLRHALLSEEKFFDENGEVIYVPFGMKLIAEKLKFLEENPDKIDLKEISSVLGEAKIETENTLRGADELFGDIVNKAK